MVVTSAVVADCQYKGGCLFLSASWHEDFAVCAKLHVDLTLTTVFLKSPAPVSSFTWKSEPSGFPPSGHVHTRWRSLFWAVIPRFGERCIFPSSGTRRTALSPSLLAAVFKKCPCSFVHLLQQQSFLLREQNPCTGYFFTQDLLMLFLLLF